MPASPNYNPDVLTCIANLSSDEVFTPPKLVSQMLDLLPAELWSDPKATFLDPGCKSGVFLREIAKRLDAGLEARIPDRQERISHILKNQLYGLAITELTALLSRRSVYCSKTANGKYSVCGGFDTPEGNIRFERIEHTWENGRCVYCGANEENYGRGEELESHAYAFIHSEHPEGIFQMKFDVIIGNPPYHLKGGGGGTNDSSIYPLFVEQAINLQPRFLVMVTPSRWLAGGRNLDAFRKRMLTAGHIREFVDYTKMSTAFPGVDFEGGVGYFLWDRDAAGSCRYRLLLGDEALPPIERRLDEYDIFVRDSRALAILQKVLAKREPTMEQIISGDTPFGLPTNFADYSKSKSKGALTVYLTVRGRRTTGWVRDKAIEKNRELISHWKVLLPEAYGERGALPAKVLGPPIVAPPNSVCTQTYLIAGPFESKLAASSVQSYILSRFFRFLVSLRKISQHALRSTYRWVPQQCWNRTWTDEALYKKYKLTSTEIAFIESMVRPMEADDEKAASTDDADERR
ncbi:MAG: Eco57I restriction-modification methylase domain-containing protein [FCB group bacterium]|jgi:site-specific DNA-methyltransferase (adenine-specific)|nr:Eco57I restriction-modification methylase domain-containing protein [FCB group bacterium]